jgi:DNA-binding IclR family transcriptional regulator
MTGESPPTDKSQIQVIARASAILRALEDESEGLSLGEIAKRVNLARSTVQRIVAALDAEKLVMAASPAGRVRLGPTILRLAGSVQTDVLAFVRPFLVKLSAELRETVDLALVKKHQIVFIDQVTGPQRLRAVSAVGEAFPLHCTANGKAYLAQLDDTAVERLVGRHYEARTPNSHTSFEALVADLRTIRRLGYALDREEHTVGISAAGVALRDMFGNAAAISVPVPSQRFEGQEEHIAQALLAAKGAIEARIPPAADAASTTASRRRGTPRAADVARKSEGRL